MKKNLKHDHIPDGQVFHVSVTDKTHGNLGQKCKYCKHVHPFDPSTSTADTTIGYRETNGNFLPLTVSEQTGEIVFAFGKVTVSVEA